MAVQTMARAARSKASASQARRAVATAQSRLGTMGKTELVQVAAPTQEAIAVRAEQVWREKGCPAGMDTEIWLEAEAQLKAERRAR